MKTVIYRIHYGFEFIYKSISSIYSWADKIIVVVSRNPWYTEGELHYRGKRVKLVHPEDIDYHINNLNFIPNVQVIEREFSTPLNQWGTLINEYSSDLVLTLEPDMVFKDLPKNPGYYDNQLEYWKNELWRIPERGRVGPVLYKSPKNIKTRFCNFSQSVPLKSQKDLVYNYGFCLKPETMLYKHLLALGFSKKIGDSIPGENWYENKWLNWTPKTRNLEISKNYSHFIKKAILV